MKDGALGSAHLLSLTAMGAVGLFVLLVAFFAPMSAHAQTPSVGCEAPAIGQFQAYIYDGEVHSFDYMVTRPNTTVSYLPLAVAINGEDVSLQYITVWEKGSQSMRIHVDVPFTNLSGAVSITTGVLQITDGPPPVCISGASFSVTLPAKQAAAPISSPTSLYQEEDVSRETLDERGDAIPSEQDEAGTTTAGESPIDTVLGTLTGRGAAGACMTQPWWVWALLTVFALAMALTAVLYMSVIVRKNSWLASSVLLPLIAFLAVWYVLDGCRDFVWFPAIVLFLAIGVLWASGTPDISERTRGRIRVWWKSVRMSVKKIRTYFVRKPKTLRLPGVDDKRSSRGAINLPATSSSSSPQSSQSQEEGIKEK